MNPIEISDQKSIQFLKESFEPKIYFGLAIASSMFSNGQIIKKDNFPLTSENVALIEGAINLCNASHTATLEALYIRYGLKLVTPKTPPKVHLSNGDRLIIAEVQGLQRLTDRHQYTQQEIDNAVISFVEYQIL